MRYIVLTTFMACILAAPLLSHAFTRADIDMLISFDLIENTSLIPLLYLLADDTPTPTADEIRALFAKDTNEEEASQEEPEATTVVRTEVLQNIQTRAYIDKAQFAGDDEKGIFEFTFEIASTNNDFWIEDVVDAVSGGFVYSIFGNTFSGDEVAYISETSDMTSTNGYYKISEGQTESFTFVVELDPDTPGIYGIQFESLTYARNSSGASSVTFNLSDRAKYRTNKLSID